MLILKTMRTFFLISAFSLVSIFHCHSQKPNTTATPVAPRVSSEVPAAVMLTAYSTTLLANGKDRTRLRIALTDSLGKEIASEGDTIRIYITGDGKVATPEGKSMAMHMDKTGKQYAECLLAKGTCNLVFIAGTKPDKVKVEAQSGKLWPGSHEIHTLPAGFVMMKPKPDQLPPTAKPIEKMIGADISFLPQIEAQGRKFFDSGQEKDAIKLLHDHGFNYIRLRIFVNPETKYGYSPGTGYCGLNQTLAMAQRIRNAGMKLLLDFHYSDYWADPQQQNKPEAWAALDFKTLQDSVRAYTIRVLLALKQQGTLPDMIQVGNEINHGILWPDGHIGNPDQLAFLLKAAVSGIEAVDAGIPVMMHLALGGQHDESVFWLDNMIARGVRFDIIGLSYYPRWHGTLEDLGSNLASLAKRYNKPVNVVEYSDYKREVHDIVFGLPGNAGKGACIWEPLGWRIGLFDQAGAATSLITVYDELKEKYLAAP